MQDDLDTSAGRVGPLHLDRLRGWRSEL